MEKIAQRIKWLRNSKGWKQKEFAEKLKISRGYYSEIESGKKMPSPSLITLIALVADTTEEWLMNSDGNGFQSAKGKAALQVARTEDETPGLSDRYPIIKELLDEAEKAAEKGVSRFRMARLLKNRLEYALLQEDEGVDVFRKTSK